MAVFDRSLLALLLVVLPAGDTSPSIPDALVEAHDFAPLTEAHYDCVGSDVPRRTAAVHPG
jgi:hypothetical protein